MFKDHLGFMDASNYDFGFVRYSELNFLIKSFIYTMIMFWLNIPFLLLYLYLYDIKGWHLISFHKPSCINFSLEEKFTKAQTIRASPLTIHLPPTI